MTASQAKQFLWLESTAGMGKEFKSHPTLADVSENLYLSQSYVSQIITRAEHDYGIKLVNRSSMPISLTEAGGSLAKGLDCLQRLAAPNEDAQQQSKRHHDCRLRATDRSIPCV